MVQQYDDKIAVVAIYTESGNPPFFHETAYEKIQNYSGATGTPLLWVDGNGVGWQYDNWADSVSKRIAEPSDLNILINGNYAEENNLLDINLRITNYSDKPITGRLHTVLTEEGVYWEGANGQNIHNAVVRNWWPNATGELVNIPAQEYIEKSIQLNVEPEWVFDSLKIVTYLQDENLTGDNTLEIFQGATEKISQIITSVENDLYKPVQLELKQNYPNPFNPSTIISYRLPIICEVELSIYNTLGQKVATLVSKNQPAGYYSVKWDASKFTSGIYIYRLQAGNFNQTKKLILMK